MFPRVTHPSAADVLLRPLDLHVLSLPPAFALSQDQTLKLKRLTSADHIITEAHNPLRRFHLSQCELSKHGKQLISTHDLARARSARTNAVHASLSQIHLSKNSTC